MEAIEGQLLNRGADSVGVKADLAKEDTVGPGNRSLPHVDRVRAEKAVGEAPQAPADRLRTLAGPTVGLDPGDPQPGELGGEMGCDPALLGERVPSPVRDPARRAPTSTGFRDAGCPQQPPDPGAKRGAAVSSPMLAPAGSRRDRHRRRSGNPQPGKGRRPRRRGHSQPASATDAGGSVRGPCPVHRRISSERKLTRPRYR